MSPVFSTFGGFRKVQKVLPQDIDGAFVAFEKKFFRVI